jgi:hypothetical protein
MATVTSSVTAPDFAGPVKDLPRLDDAPGAELELLVLATDRSQVVGIDLASGTLVRAWSPEPVHSDLAPYDVALATLQGDFDAVPDPAEPEAVALAGAPSGIGHMGGRRAERLIRRVLHPTGQPLLGFNAPTVLFWQRRPDHPSIAIVEPEGRAEIVEDDGYFFCEFGWRGTLNELPCLDWRIARSLADSPYRSTVTERGDRLLVGLTPPYQGHCHKVVVGVLPRP